MYSSIGNMFVTILPVAQPTDYATTAIYNLTFNGNTKEFTYNVVTCHTVVR